MNKDVVILVHGHGAPALLLEPLRRSLTRHGYQARIWRYRSLVGSLSNHADNFSKTLEDLEADARIARLHLVGHSMGAIIVRTALAQRIPVKLGRVVLLAPPNHGARLADFALRIFGGPLAARELSSQSDSFVNKLPPVDAEIGIVAATWDHVVSIDSTHLVGQTDHVVLKSFHTLPLHRKVPSLIDYFLRNGQFPRS